MFLAVKSNQAYMNLIYIYIETYVCVILHVSIYIYSNLPSIRAPIVSKNSKYTLSLHSHHESHSTTAYARRSKEGHHRVVGA